ncbi:MAG: alpha-xylosidase [Spirochaetales bacterium]|nr:alpha-xylosidase [Spirochaetales bacterium]
MKQGNRFVFDFLDQDSPEAVHETIWSAGKPESVISENNSVIIRIPFQALKMENFFLKPHKEIQNKVYEFVVRFYGDSVIRVTSAFGDDFPDDNNPMFEWSPEMKQKALKSVETCEGYCIEDENGILRMKINTGKYPVRHWSDLQPEPQDSFEAIVYPDGKTAVPFMSYDTFFPHQIESLSAGFVSGNGIVKRCLFSLHAKPGEKFAGTGERFSEMNLSGKTLVLENTDGLGVNSRRAYKNIPFYVSSKGYGLLIMTSAHVRLSLADISTRAVQGLIEDDILDLFFIGGGSVESIVLNYRRISGFPRPVPDWSYGTWMSRMTYFSADETREIVRKMREQQFPLDVIHLDSGWFEKNWKCEWEFSKKNFPNPEKYLKEMEDKGIKISLWQLPFIAKDTKHYETALKNNYIARKNENISLGSNFSDVEFSGTIDFTNPKAAQWYQGLIGRLLKMGAAVIKTDFGEAIEEDAVYLNLPYKKLHNVYSLLYQKTAYEISESIKGKNDTMIWARAGWTGCHRYPVHWGGDCVSSWDGLAGTIRGGLHIGISGFAFWSHDIPGFHGTPSFMNSCPEDALYVRWTQTGVFTSHLRYHGSNVREPYEYPGISGIVRNWLHLRYSLIPYIIQEGKKAITSGYPLFRALIFHHDDDPVCWNIDDQFYFGDSFLIAPVLNDEGIRNVYLPEGNWTDFWTGGTITGPVWLKNIESPLAKIPVYVKTGHTIPVYPEIVQSTHNMNFAKNVYIKFDSSYSGFANSILGKLIDIK